MEASGQDIIILPLIEKHLVYIVRIAENSGLSAWTLNEYLAELRCENSFGYVSFIKDRVNEYPSNKNLDELYNSPESTNGFVIARLIRYSSSDSVSLDAEINNTLISSASLFNNECEILNIAVQDQERGKGIGQKPLNNVLDECRRQRADSVWLEVRQSNENAVGFYRKNGFDVIYARKNYYRNPVEDALVMKADLSATLDSSSY